MNVHELHRNPKPYRPKICLGIPTTGLVRYEWHAAYNGIIVPTNWECSAVTQFCVAPIDYTVAEGRNMIVKTFLEKKQYDWLFFIDHDVICPPSTFIWADEWVRSEPSPIVGGLYYTKGYPAEPLVYRGKGTGGYKGFTLGERVQCDGMGMGFTLIHRELLEAMAKRSPHKQLSDGTQYSEVFRTPRETFFDPESGMWARLVGTEDLLFCRRVIEEGALLDTRWAHLSKEEFPFLMDTNMFCWHMQANGTRYPIEIDLPPGFDEWDRKLKSQRWQSKG